MPPAPSAAKIAAENKIDLASVAGSGKRGQVLKGDVLAAVAEARAPAPARARAGSSAGACANSGPRSGSRARGAHDHSRRQRPRRAGAHDQAAPDHRAPPQGRAKHRRDADDLQRGRHERSDGVARPLQGRVREEALRQARLHGLLREGLRSGAERNPGRQRRDRRRRPRLQELLPHRHRRRHRQGAHRAGGARRGQAVDRRDREVDRRARQARPRRPAQARGAAGRNVHHHQRRHLRLADVDADSQRAAVGHPRHAQDPGAAGRGRRARSRFVR